VNSRICSIYRAASVFGVALLLLLSACADGGVGGTGISTVQGNVLNVDGAEIVVREPVSGLEDTTNEEGEFRLVGRMPLETTLLFFAPSTEEPATMGLTVPPGSEITLERVQFEDTEAVPETIYLSLPVADVISDSECAGTNGRFDMDVDGLVFNIIVDSNTVFEKSRTCADVTKGSRIKVSGRQDGDTVTAARVNIVKSGTTPGS